jgi:spore maturation protein CgeB
LAKLEAGDYEYLAPSLISQYDLYLSFTGGGTLRDLETRYGAKVARPLYCAVDPSDYFPDPQPTRWALAFMGTYSAERQPALERLLLDPARSLSGETFCVAGSMFPSSEDWPENVERIEHVAPAAHRAFYNSQNFTLNLTRTQMIRAGYSPSVRLFEAAACGTPVVSDWWPGLDEFFLPDREILIAETAADVVKYLRDVKPQRRAQIAEAARLATLSKHTGAHRAQELETYFMEAADRSVRATLGAAPRSD